MATEIANPQTVTVTAPGLTLSPAVRQFGMLLALAAAVALGVAVAMWSQTPNYGLLYGSLSDKDTANVLDGLTKSGISYKIEAASGAILVPNTQIHEARLKLASQGLPKGTGVGFELMDEKPGFGTSQFQETARYQRAIEGELARSVMTLSNVQSARVHLAIPRQSAFIREREPPSASVIVNLYAGRPLEDEQVSAIVHLVAASVPNLPASRVTVIDQKGKLLTASEASNDLSQRGNQLAYTHKLEASYIKRIEELLAPVVGVGAVKAQVAADLDFTITEQTSEIFNPERQLVRSEQTAEDISAAGATAGGIPGALSNQPPGAVSVPEVAAKPAAGGPPPATPGGEAQTGVAASPAPPMNSSKRATRNYEIDKTISHTRQATGTVRRLSVAVVVDDAVTTSKKGKVTRTSRTPEDLARFTALVKEAVGFDEKRGDSVNVVNAAFNAPPAAAPLPETPLWKQDWVWDLAKQVGGALAALLVLLMVVRPLLRGLAVRPAGPAGLLPAAGGPAPDRVSLGAQASAAQLGGPGGYEASMNTARQVAAQDPKRVAQVVKNWVASDA